MKAFLRFEFSWESTPTDFSKCNKCENMIFGNMFIPIIVIGETKNLDISEIENVKLCEYCYTEL